jgi:hypothetical protein
MWATIYAGHYAAWQGAVANAYANAAIQNIMAWSDAARSAADASTSQEIAAAGSTASARRSTATATRAAQRSLAGATHGSTTARTNAGRTRDLELQDIRRDAEIEDTEMDSSENQDRVDAAIAAYSSALSASSSAFSSSSQSARDQFRSALTDVDRQSARDSADRSRDYDLAIVDLSETFGTKVTINNTQAELTVAAADYIWAVGQIDAELAGAAVAAGVFPSPQTQIPYQNLQDGRSDKVSAASQRYTDRSAQITADQTSQLAEISADAAQERVDINSSHAAAIAAANLLERTGTIYIPAIETPDAIGVNDVSASAFGGKRAREAAVYGLPGAHDHGGLSGAPKLPGLAASSFVAIDVYNTPSSTYRVFGAGEMGEGAGTILQPPRNEGRNYTYQVTDADLDPDDPTPTESEANSSAKTVRPLSNVGHTYEQQGFDWLDRNFGGGHFGQRGWSGAAISWLMEGLSFVPPAGAIKGLVQSVTGVGNNGEDLGAGDRALELAGVVPGGKILAKLKGAGAIAGAGGLADDALDVVNSGRKSLAKAPKSVVTGTANVSTLKGRQLASEFSGNKIKRLRRDIRTNGFDPNHPIEIAIVDGRKIIIDGHHRARAAGAAGVKEVPVIIKQVSPNEATTLFQQAAEAAERFGLPF